LGGDLGFQVTDIKGRRTGSIGVLAPNCECKLVDDSGTEVVDGERGEIYFRGPNVCLGYWKNEAANRDLFTLDQWLKTGDIAVRRNGWFWIVDRKKVPITYITMMAFSCNFSRLLIEL
jgi:4-coumarate--CoA ligase